MVIGVEIEWGLKNFNRKITETLERVISNGRKLILETKITRKKKISYTMWNARPISVLCRVSSVISNGILSSVDKVNHPNKFSRTILGGNEKKQNWKNVGLNWMQQWVLKREEKLPIMVVWVEIEGGLKRFNRKITETLEKVLIKGCKLISETKNNKKERD